jgi:hypothetical protein
MSGYRIVRDVHKYLQWIFLDIKLFLELLFDIYIFLDILDIA